MNFTGGRLRGAPSIGSILSSSCVLDEVLTNIAMALYGVDR